MPDHVIIDGNNLLHAMHVHAPIPAIGRETMVKVIERWARRGDDDVTLVFDGPVPHGGLAQQMASARIDVRFSAPRTADDIIVDLIQRAKHPPRLRVITGDTAIRHETRMRRGRDVDAETFIRELFPASEEPQGDRAASREKPAAPDADETQAWIDEFGLDEKDLSLGDEFPWNR
jgi:predicted RNA-binding protein with PIN domain